MGKRGPPQGQKQFCSICTAAGIEHLPAHNKRRHEELLQAHGPAPPTSREAAIEADMPKRTRGGGEHREAAEAVVALSARKEEQVNEILSNEPADRHVPVEAVDTDTAEDVDEDMIMSDVGERDGPAEAVEEQQREEDAEPPPTAELPLGIHAEWINSQRDWIKERVKLKRGGPGSKKPGTRVEGEWPIRTGYEIPPPHPALCAPLSLEKYLLKSVFIWAPEYIYRKEFPRGVLPCPSCERDKNVISEGFNPKGGRRVVGIHDTYHLLCKRYRCRSCRLSYDGYDFRVLDLLPEDVVCDFPAFVTKRSAIDIKLVAELRETGRKNFPVFLRNLKQRHMATYANKKKSWETRLRREVKDQDQVANYPAFPAFSDPKGYAGYIPSVEYLKAVIQEDSEREKRQQTRAQRLALQATLAPPDSPPATTSIENMGSTRKKRKPARCIVCGHHKAYGKWKEMHDFNAKGAFMCRVPKEMYSTTQAVPNDSQKKDYTWHACPCDDCQDLLPDEFRELTEAQV